MARILRCRHVVWFDQDTPLLFNHAQQVVLDATGVFLSWSVTESQENNLPFNIQQFLMCLIGKKRNYSDCFCKNSFCSFLLPYFPSPPTTFSKILDLFLGIMFINSLTHILNTVSFYLGISTHVQILVLLQITFACNTYCKP